MIVLANHDVVAIRPSSLGHEKKFCVGLKRSLTQDSSRVRRAPDTSKMCSK